MTIDNLIDCLETLANTQMRYNKAYEEYDGYSWDYAGHDVIKELGNAKTSLRMVLNSYIDSRVETILANREPSRDDILSRIPQ